MKKIYESNTVGLLLHFAPFLGSISFLGFGVEGFSFLFTLRAGVAMVDCMGLRSLL